jgi:uncharacterized protein (DUF4415 family)
MKRNETFKSGRGGARPGAGRPEAENPKVRVSYRLAPDVVKWIRAQPGGPTKAIETVVRAAIESDDKPGGLQFGDKVMIYSDP